MYRTAAIVEPKTISLAEQCRKLSEAARKQIEERNKLAALDPSVDKKAKRLYLKVLRDIKKESDKGKNSLFWSNSDFIFGKWTVPLPVAEAICKLLKEDKFSCRPSESCSDPGYYYISVDW